MAIPTVLTDLSATLASNPPAGGDAAFPNIDDYLRAAYGFIRQGDTKASDVASAASTAVGAAVGRIVDVTGVVTITSFGTVAAGIWRIVRFTGALTLTHNAVSLILPGGANITTVAGDCLVAVSLGSGNWVVTQYQRNSSPAGEFSYAGKTGDQTGIGVSAVAITFTARQDPGSNFASNVFTAPTNGYYEVEVSLLAYTGASQNIYVGFSIDAGAVQTLDQHFEPCESGVGRMMTFRRVLSLTAGQTVGIRMFTNSGTFAVYGSTTLGTEAGWFYARAL